MTVSGTRKKEILASFQKGAAPSGTDFSNRPISHTAGKIIGAALIVDGLTFVGSLLQTGANSLPSMIGCVIGVGIARLMVFGRSDVLDQKRWDRFWHGDLLGYWLSYLPLLFTAMGSNEESLSGNVIGAYFLASVIALIFGFLNVRLRDQRDKEEIAHCLQEWHRSQPNAAAVPMVTAAPAGRRREPNHSRPPAQASAVQTSPVVNTDGFPPEAIRRLSEEFDRTFVSSSTGPISTMKFEPDRAFALVDKIDDYLEAYPGNTDLFLAKSSVLRQAMQWKSGEDVIDEILSRDPCQFDARLIKDEWDTWQHLLQCPACDVTTRQLSPALRQATSCGSVVLVRDGIKLAVALVQDVSELRFKSTLRQDMRCKWEFVQADTPHGRIVAHYSFVEDAPGCSYLREQILPTGRPQKADGASGYWLLQRLARQSDGLFLLVSGNQVLYSKRCVFPQETRTRLKTIADCIARDPKPTLGMDDFQAAIKWHTNHFDDTVLRF